jgi:hypothetical protein
VANPQDKNGRMSSAHFLNKISFLQALNHPEESRRSVDQSLVEIK